MNLFQKYLRVPAIMPLVILCWLVSLSPTSAQEKPAAAPRKPAILFACPGENRYAYAGYDYMRELVKAGFEVDYCEGQSQLTWGQGGQRGPRGHIFDL